MARSHAAVRITRRRTASLLQPNSAPISASIAPSSMRRAKMRAASGSLTASRFPAAATCSRRSASATDDRVVMRATIERHHDDYGGSETTGALATNADGDDLLYTAANVEGRIAITAMWHDDLDRVVDVVRYGTNGGSNFDRDGLSVPARSDTALRTTTTFNDDIKDADDQVTTYDDRGRGRGAIAVRTIPGGVRRSRRIEQYGGGFRRLGGCGR